MYTFSTTNKSRFHPSFFSSVDAAGVADIYFDIGLILTLPLAQRKNQQCGKLRLGDRTDSIFNQYPKERIGRRVRYHDEGIRESVYVVYQTAQKKKPMLHISAHHKNIKNIKIFSSSFRTEEDIGVGSSYSQVQALYPNAKYHLVYHETTKVIQVPKLSMSFFFRPWGRTRKKVMEVLCYSRRPY